MFAGKTTLARKLAAARGGTLVAEHTDFDPSEAARCSEPWPGKPAAMVDRQRAFLLLDVRRCARARAALDGGSTVVLDRTFLSPLAYMYARVRAGDAPVAAFAALVDAALEMLDVGILWLPGEMHHLDVPDTVCRMRARANDASIRRGTELFLLRGSTIRAVNAFHRGVLGDTRYARGASFS